MPTVIPLGISFFTFELVHYLVDVRHGHQPIRRLRDFLAFILFWPTMVAGPIKRYQQFTGALQQGMERTTSQDTMLGISRIAIGCAKKWAADNLSSWITFLEPHFSEQTLSMKWLFVGALAFRILLDFSGYSDMAIGFARMMGISVPENFNWPYLARSPADFWRRWHISLSTWIRDYVYIPLGGSRLGAGRPKGSKHKLQTSFWNDLHRTWKERGPDALRWVADNDPSTFVRVCASLMPKEETAKQIDHAIEVTLKEPEWLKLQPTKSEPLTIEQRASSEAEDPGSNGRH